MTVKICDLFLCRPLTAIVAGGFLLALGACSTMPEGPDPLLKLKPFGAITAIAIGGPEANWVMSSEDILTDGTIEAITDQSIPAIQVTSGDKPFFLYRQTRSLLTVTPYLSWNWKVSDFAGPYHPIRLVVGFSNSLEKPDSLRTGLFKTDDNSLPEATHRVDLVWSQFPLARGNAQIQIIEGKATTQGRYIVRGGADGLDRWHLETVDLAALARRLWPDQNQTSFRVVYMGVEATHHLIQKNHHESASTKTYLSGLLLNR